MKEPNKLNRLEMNKLTEISSTSEMARNINGMRKNNATWLKKVVILSIWEKTPLLSSVFTCYLLCNLYYIVELDFLVRWRAFEGLPEVLPLRCPRKEA
jgi:hypothetical protein